MDGVKFVQEDEGMTWAEGGLLPLTQKQRRVWTQKGYKVGSWGFPCAGPATSVTSAFIMDTEGGALPRAKCQNEVGV